jgi:hypothetical protein
MNLSKRLERLEEIVEKHLIQSGSIQADLKWLKKAIWALFTLVLMDSGFHLWK